MGLGDQVVGDRRRIRKACLGHSKGTSTKDEVIRWSFPAQRSGQGDSLPEHARCASKADRDSSRRDHREGVHGDTPYSPLKGSRSKEAVVTPRMGNLVE